MDQDQTRALVDNTKAAIEANLELLDQFATADCLCEACLCLDKIDTVVKKLDCLILKVG